MRPARASISCPGSSTSTCTASRAGHARRRRRRRAQIAARLPRYGVTAFCPTSVACAPAALRADARRRSARARERRRPAARACCRRISRATSSIPTSGARSRSTACVDRGRERSTERRLHRRRHPRRDRGGARRRRHRHARAGARRRARSHRATLVAHGHRVSLGHSGATYEQALAGIEAGATHATHLFNRMPPLGHRAPGLAGAVLASDDVAAEIICDGVHVHPAVVPRRACRERRERRSWRSPMAPRLRPAARSHAQLGGRTITRRRCRLPRRRHARGKRADDGSGVPDAGARPSASACVDAALMCSTTPARALGLQGLGRHRGRGDWPISSFSTAICGSADLHRRPACVRRGT